MRNQRLLPLLVVASLVAPFLLLHLAPDFDTGNMFVQFAPSNAAKFLRVVLPGLAIGALLGLGLKYLGKLRERVALPRSQLLEHPARLSATVLIIALGGCFLGTKFLSLGTFVCLYMILSLGLNVTVGMTGLLVLGFSGFYAVGAYAFAVVQQFAPLPWWSGLPIGLLAGLLAGWLVGLPCLRLRGDYLAIVTLGFAEAFRELVRNLSVTGSDMGINLGFPSRVHALGPLSAAQASWVFGTVLVALCALAIHRLYHSRIGRAWIAVREDEVAAASMGIPVVRLKLLAFSVSAGLAGLAGAFFAGFTGFVDPSTSTFDQSVLILAMVILGGLGSLSGSLLGAALLYLAPNLLRDAIPEISDYRLLFFGFLLVAMMLFRPQGLLGASRHRSELEGGKA